MDKKEEKGLTTEKLRLIMCDSEMPEAHAQEIVRAIKDFVHIIVEIQYEQELSTRSINASEYKQAA